MEPKNKGRMNKMKKQGQGTNKMHKQRWGDKQKAQKEGQNERIGGGTNKTH